MRELKNIIERSVIFAENGIADSSVIPCHKDLSGISSAGGLSGLGEALKGTSHILRTVQEMVVQTILAQERGNIARAAERLGVSRQTLYNKIKKKQSL